MPRFLLLLSILFFLSTNLSAGHILGGGIDWDCQGNGDYQFRLTIYTDCTGAGMGASQNIQGPFGSINCVLISSGASNINGNCNSGCIQQRWVYLSDTVSLSGVPPTNGWEFFWNACCRDYEQNVAMNSAIYLESKMYSYTPPNASAPLSADSCYSHSAKFQNTDPLLICTGPYSYHHQIGDADYDSVSISFTPPKANSFSNVTFAAGFDYQNPFPDSTENPNNGPVTLDPSTGLLQTNFSGAPAGNYFAAYLLKEYRDGQLIAELIRDIPLVVLDSVLCLPAATNNRPNLSISSNNGLSLVPFAGGYAIDIRQGDSLDLDIVASDFDFNNMGIPQTFCLRGFSPKLNPNNMTLDTGCIGGNCAKVVPNGTGGFCNSISGSYNFTWSPDCSLIKANSFGPTLIPFTFEVEDNACPIPKSRSLNLMVRMYSAPLFPSSLSLVSADTLGNVTLSWTRAAVVTGTPFSAYRIYSRNLGGSFNLLDSISDIDSLQASYTNLAYPSEFYIEVLAGSCAAGSPASATISSDLGLSIEKHQALSFSLAPNPAKAYVSLSLDHLSDFDPNLKAYLYSSNGNLLKVYHLDLAATSWRLELNQAPGRYWFELRGKKGRFAQPLIVKP